VTQIIQNPDVFGDASLLWLGEEGTGLQVRLFRKTFELASEANSMVMSLYAQMRFHVWFNGEYIGRGPVFHAPQRLPIARLDLTGLAVKGTNVVAVLVSTSHMALHNGVPAGEPGLIAAIDVKGSDGASARHVTDSTWRTTDKTGWRSDAPKRGWALGPVEVFDAAQAPDQWWRPGFDDSAWASPKLGKAPLPVPPVDAQLVTQQAGWFYPQVPALRYKMRAPVKVIDVSSSNGVEHVIRGDDAPEVYGRAIQGQPRELAVGINVQGPDANGRLVVSGLTRARPTVVTLDLGRVDVGQMVMHATCPSEGIIDITWTERKYDGRVASLLKNCSYVDRVLARLGSQAWESINFSAAQYISISLRGFAGTIVFDKLALRASEPDLAWRGHFKSDDVRLNAVWDLCVHSLRVGTQEAVMDCPTREQAPYIGDGNPVASWIHRLTGDASHWRYVVRETFSRQSPDGFLRPAIFSGALGTLIDYNLLAVISARDYLVDTGDIQTLRDIREGCLKTLAWFTKNIGPSGLFEVDCAKLPMKLYWEHAYEPGLDNTDKWYAMAFIDHPGTGWHNLDEPGIDRSGVNTAMQALLIVALRAMGDIEQALGNVAQAEKLRQQAQALARAAKERLWDAERGLFPDGIGESGLHKQASQQANTWCVWAGLAEGAQARELMLRLHETPGSDLARSGPYFWCYTLPVLARCGLHAEALEHIRRRWGTMLEHGASTLWETFSGDHLDSWCHPWAGAPVEFLLKHILGLDAPGHGKAGPVVLRPRYDLLNEASGAMHWPSGLVEIGWESTRAGRVLRGRVPAGHAVVVQTPDGRRIGPFEGEWRVEV
jgi:alpha-L-rhamnosidase